MAGLEGRSPNAASANNIEIAIRYIESWLRGNGAVALRNLMEDAATAEISRSQLWQWIHQSAITDTGEVITREWVEDMLDEEFANSSASKGTASPTRGTFSRKSRSATSSRPS